MLRVQEPTFPAKYNAIPGIRMFMETHTGTGTTQEEYAVIKVILDLKNTNYNLVIILDVVIRGVWIFHCH